MNFKRTFLSSIILFSATATMFANAGEISFDEFGPQGCCFHAQEALDTEYVHEGVIFGGGWEILHHSGGFGIMPRSGQHFAAYDSLDIDLGISNTLTLTFAGAASHVSGYLGDDESSSWTLTTRFKGDLVSERLLINPAGRYAHFDFGPSQFDELTIRGAGSSAVIDDLAFDLVQTQVQVSAPPAAGLVLLGLLGTLLPRRGTPTRG
ncbi:hypothetical protein [Allohahella sp. A8]|uniref:hypothetical protein n=1 Tax=Allohahella sp. A8 TaxID=3141461 RepID=UPI003A80B65A